MLPKIFDIILNKRFNFWFTSNPYQAGYKTNQGCMLQLFVIVLLIEHANSADKSLFLGLCDYEKAFDSVNKADLVKNMIDKGAGKRFVNSIYNMYKETTYKPRLENNMTSAGISTRYGVTQGRKSSENYFCFVLEDMSHVITSKDLLVRDVKLLQ